MKLTDRGQRVKEAIAIRHRNYSHLYIINQISLEVFELRERILLDDIRNGMPLLVQIGALTPEDAEQIMEWANAKYSKMA